METFYLSIPYLYKVPVIFKYSFSFDYSNYGDISVKPSQSSVELLRLFASYTSIFAPKEEVYECK